MNEKKLRDALEVYASEDKWQSQLWPCWEPRSNVFRRCDVHGYELAQKALAEAGEPEMMRLLRWLKKTMRANYIYGGRIAYYQEVIKHIEQEFGYKLEDYGD